MRAYAQKSKAPPQVKPAQSPVPAREQSEPTSFYPGFGHDFSRIPVHAVDDPPEREADATAARVMRMPAPGQERRDAAPLRIADPGIVQDVLQGAGQPLDQTTRDFFEPRFGTDFSRVRVHTDERAAESARALNALGYTVGGNVVFAAGKYAPATSAGGRLLAHELAHVVQQGAGGIPGRVQRQPDPNAHSHRFEGDKFAGLKKGDTGLPVTRLQQALVDLGYPNPVDGNFQEPTEKALKDFQKAQKFPKQSGKVDAATLNALTKAFDTRKPYTDQATNDPAHPGTRPLSATDRTAAAAAMVPSGIPPFKETIKKGKYGDRIEKLLTTRIFGTDKAHGDLTGDEDEFIAKESLPKDATNLDDWAVIEKTAGVAQAAVDKLYGSYYSGGGKMALTQASGLLKDQFAEEVADNAKPETGKDKGKKENKAREFARELIDSIADDINREHSADPSRPEEKKIISGIVEKWVSDPDKMNGLLHEGALWPGWEDPATGKVGLQRFKDTDPDPKKAMEKNRLRMWALFQICIHEYLHARAHKDFVTWAFSFQNIDDPRFHMLTEGFDDFFNLNVRKTVNQKAVQADVEGPYANRNPPPPMTFPTFPSVAQVEHLISIVGIKNAQAAYFEGKTDLIGGPATTPAKK